ncbi:zinc finger CCHC domain-containing protein 7 [Dryobates pubescens]|uniref:zinc finger CCHC domain-containing protein 7 n=1 Tax=Dryobates pubescens TaxID=118200 RepID=UPI0023B9C698|nr:zinc finger CCHC domain-containing protein 7 [Dryobates pubescens]
MFFDHESIEDPEEYEDELYQEESSSEQSIDSEVEFHLYSQIHYSQNLGEASSLGRDEEGGAAGLRDGPPAPGEQHREEGSSAAAAGSAAQAAEDPEVIVLSDGPEDDSVYTSKAKRPRRSNAQGKAQIQPATSTPMQAEGAAHTMWGSSKKRKSSSKQLSPVSPAGAFALQEVLVIESSEEESLESESDHIESWMLVGAGSDDKDGDIILNLEGCATPTSQGDPDVDWSISTKDLEAQISNFGAVRRSGARYYTANKNVTCRNCARQGHLSKNCPVPKRVPPCCLCARRGHLQHSCPARFCQNCSLPGHCFRDCLEKPFWNKQCNRCHMQGHYADACPEIWRQYHLTTQPGQIQEAGPRRAPPSPAYCYNCSRRGHFGYECSEKRMHESMLPAYPFICCYDDKQEIRRRAFRVKRKAEELQGAGLLPQQPPTLGQEGPSHSKKSKSWREHRKQQKDGKWHRKMAEGPGEEQHRGHGLEEDFPRGLKRQAWKGSRSHRVPMLQAFTGSRALCVPGRLEAASRRKKSRKQKNAGPGASDNLFLIKQRRKKPKEKPW